MAATGVQLNWSSVSYASTPITKVTGGGFDEGINLVMFSGDANTYDIVAAVGVNKPTATFTTGDIGLALTLPSGSGTLIATLNDAKGASAGAINFTMANAYLSGNSSTAQHATIGSATLNWIAVSTDGTTNPISFTRS